MTTQTEETPITSLEGIAIPKFDGRPAAEIVAPGMKSADLAETIDAKTMERMLQAESEVEFNEFVEALQGDEEIEVGMLKKIAKLIAKPAFEKSAKSAREASAARASLAKLQARIEQLEQEKNELAESVSKDKTQTTQQQQFQSLSTACGTLGVNLEASLAQEDVVQVLKNESRVEDSPFTYLEEVTALITKGKYSEAAKIVKLAVDKAKGEKAEPPADPKGTAASASVVKPPEENYYEKLTEITNAYAQSNKTFEDTKLRNAKLADLKKRFNMG